MNTTRKYRRLSFLFGTIRVLLNIAPFAIYAFIALINSTLLYQKTVLCMTVFIVGIMSLITLFQEVAMKSRLWIVLVGIYVCLGQIITPLIIIAVCQVLDELIVAPLHDSYRDKKSINKEIDKRL